MLALLKAPFGPCSLATASAAVGSVAFWRAAVARRTQQLQGVGAFGCWLYVLLTVLRLSILFKQRVILPRL